MRWEWPNGEPVKGPRTKFEGGRHVPIEKHGGPAQQVTYGAPRLDRVTGVQILGIRSTIKLTPEGAAALKDHLDLELASPAEVKQPEGKTEPKAGADPKAHDSEGDKGGEPDPKAKVPEDWRELSESRQRGLAAKISGQPKDDIAAAQAVAIIEAHLAAGGSNT
jgi:hypothetical protein